MVEGGQETILEMVEPFLEFLCLELLVLVQVSGQRRVLLAATVLLV
jgi:hypothetical protein